MILSFINIRKVAREVLKTEGKGLGFQHFPRDLVNVNKWKIMFDPSMSKVDFPIPINWTGSFENLGVLGVPLIENPNSKQ